MTSEEYVQQIERLMDLQNTYLQVFLWILGASISILSLIQWRFTSRQLKEMKEKTKQETIKEIEKLLDVSNIVDFKDDTTQKFNELKTKNDKENSQRFHYELTVLFNENDVQLWKINYILEVYEDYILNSIKNFNFVVSRISSYILCINDQREEKVVDFNSPHIDNIIKKLTNFEKKFNEESESLRNFESRINYCRNNERK